MVIPFIDIHTHHPLISTEVFSVSSLFLQQVNEHQNVPFTAGIHPWHADQFSLQEITMMLNNLLKQKHCLALGEIGLDKKSKVDFDVQKAVFELQFDFAQQNNFPLVIHNVKAWNEMIVYLKKSSIPFIFHGFQANESITRQLLLLPCYFSIGEVITLPKQPIREILKQIPSDRLFFETDETFFDIREVYQTASEILNISFEELKEKIYSNFQTVMMKTAQ